MKWILAAAAALAALAATGAMADPGCLQLGRIWTWNAPDNKTLIVEDDIHQKFKLSLAGYCPDLQFKERIGFKVYDGSALTCMARGDWIAVRKPGLDGRCPIASIVPYTAEMQKADEAAAAAKATGSGGN
jgi:hypothetical protein